MKRITVLLAEDHSIVLEGLKNLLNQEEDIEVVGEAANGREAVDLAGKLCPGVVVMDIAMPLLNGMEATRQIMSTSPETKVLILSAHNDDAYVERAMTVGASGYLIKQTASHVLVEAIRTIHKGGEFFSPFISNRFLHCKEKTDGRDDPVTKGDAAKLSTREMEVLQLVAEGKANKQMAGELHISIKTVEKHRQSLMGKLNIHDTAGLTRYAIATGVIESSVQVTIV